MPIDVAPPFMEFNDFSGGWMPDLDPASVPPNGLLGAKNVLPDRLGGGLETRKGYKRFGDFFIADGHIAAINSFNLVYGAIPSGKRYIIAVVDKELGNEIANNVEVWAISLDDGTSQRIDDADRPWRVAVAQHFGETIDQTFFGGGEIDPMYSYRPFFVNGEPNPDPWEPDVTMDYHVITAWQESTAYVVGDRRRDGGQAWVCIKDHSSHVANRPKEGRNADRFWQRMGKQIPAWGTGNSYKLGDKVARLVTDNPNFPRGYRPSGEGRRFSIFRARTDHTSDNDNGPPGDRWEPARGPRSNTAIYRGSRLFMRDTDQGTSRVQYSERIKADGLWDAANWDITDIHSAGFMDIRTGDGDDVRALAELDNILLIFKERSVHALTGLSPSTWSLRRISDRGSLFKDAVVVTNGLCFFFSAEGLMVTDGAMVQPVPGMETIREWFHKNMVLGPPPFPSRRVRMEVHDNRIWISFRTNTTEGDTVLVYDLVHENFWPIEGMGPIRGWARSAINRTDTLFFSKLTSPAVLYQYNHPDANDKDDIGEAVFTSQHIPWSVRLAWFNFGIARVDRLVRRSWAALRTLKEVTFKAYKNFVDTPVWTTITDMNGPVGWVEGRVVQQANSISYSLESDESPANILGLGVETVVKRHRYHRGNPNG